MLYYIPCISCTVCPTLMQAPVPTLSNMQSITSSTTSSNPDPVESSQLTQLQMNIVEVKEMCQSLTKRQAEFEQQLVSRLDQIQYYLDELIVLAPTPVQSMQSVQMEFTASTPKPAHPLCEHSTGDPREVLLTLPSQPNEAVNEVMGVSSTNETDLHVPPLSLSLIRDNSCSRENFASKLVKEMFIAEEHSSTNVKGVLGEEIKREENALHSKAYF